MEPSKNGAVAPKTVGRAVLTGKVVSDKMDKTIVVAIEERRLHGVFRQKEYRRFYPGGEVTSHLIGFTNIDDVGQEGLELAYNDWLSGQPGLKRVIRDRLGRTVDEVEMVRESVPGRDLTLTIDRRLQYLAYRELKRTVLKHGARSGSVVLLDVDTGEVLAMVNQPSYNPNNSDIGDEALRRGLGPRDRPLGAGHTDRRLTRLGQHLRAHDQRSPQLRPDRPDPADHEIVERGGHQGRPRPRAGAHVEHLPALRFR